MQFPAVAKPPVGILFDSAMERIDDVLALAMLHGLEGKDEARLAAVSISRPDLAAAKFCDAVRAFYASATTGPAALFMHFAPIGLAEGQPAATLPMLNVALEPNGSIKTIEDTADPATLMRNVVMAQYDQDAAIVLSGPATDLARWLELQGAKDWIARKVRVLCVVESTATKVPADWPTAIVTVGREVGEALPYPGASVDRDFAWSAAHPVVAAYRAYRPMPYDAPGWTMAAILYAAHPNDNYFQVSGGRLMLDPGQKDRIIRAYIDLVSAKPVPRKPRHPVEEKKDQKKAAK